MVKRITKILLCTVLSAAIVICAGNAYVRACAAVSSTVTEIISCVTLDDNTVSGAGTSTADWYVLSCARLGISGDYNTYVDNIISYISENADHLSPTDYQRMALTVNACASMTDSGNDAQTLGLLDEAVYAVLDSDDLSSELVNKLIFALLTLDSLRYTPDEGYESARESLISAILTNRMDSGAFALNDTADTDITAMTVQALSPYMNSSYKFTFTGQDGTKLTMTVGEVIDSAVEYLSSVQTDNGDMKSWGTANCESTAQTIAALCSVGIDPDSDERFVKNNNSLIDGLLSYRVVSDDNSNTVAFAHTISQDGTLTENSLSTAQALYALCAYCRSENGYRNLYDMRAELSADTYSAIGKLKYSISELERSLNTDTDADTFAESVSQLMSDCADISVGDRMYITNFNTLVSMATTLGTDNTADYSPQDLCENTSAVASLTDVTADRNADKSTSITNDSTTFETLDTASSDSGTGGTDNIVEIVILSVILAAAIAVIVINHKRNPKSRAGQRKI